MGGRLQSRWAVLCVTVVVDCHVLALFSDQPLWDTQSTTPPTVALSLWNLTVPGSPSGSLNPGAWLTSEAMGVGWQSDFMSRPEALWGGFRVKEEVVEVWGSLTISYKVGGRVF